MPRKKLPKMRMVEGSKRLVKVPGKTLDVTCTSGEQLMMTKKAARDFLGIKHHRTLNTAIAILGISLPLDWNDLKRLIGLKLFLERNHGDRRASKETYRAFELAGRIEELHAFYKIDIETELKRRKNAYFGYSEQSSAG